MNVRPANPSRRTRGVPSPPSNRQSCSHGSCTTLQAGCSRPSRVSPRGGCSACLLAQRRWIRLVVDDGKYTALTPKIAKLTDLIKIIHVRLGSGEIVVAGHGGVAKTIVGPRQLVTEAALGQGRLVGARARAWQNVIVWRGNVREGTLDEIRLCYSNERTQT